MAGDRLAGAKRKAPEAVAVVAAVAVPASTDAAATAASAAAAAPAVGMVPKSDGRTPAQRSHDSALKRRVRGVANRTTALRVWWRRLPFTSTCYPPDPCSPSPTPGLPPPHTHLARSQEKELASKSAALSHRQKIDGLNEYLSKLPQHNDIFKISYAGTG